MARRPQREPARPTTGGAVLAVALGCAAVAGALYAAALSFGFVNWDDWEYVLLNPHLGALDPAFLRWCLTANLAGNWHPATLLSYGLDFAFWERDPAGYHATNVALHAANSALVVWLAWGLLRRSLGPTPGSLFGATLVGLVFAAHPLHVESVAWISERKDLLYAFFWLASLIAWLAYTDAGRSPRGRKGAYALALAAFALSAASKPMAVTLPLVLLLLDAIPQHRLTRASWVRVVVVEKLPFFALSLATGVVTLAAQGARGALDGVDLSLGERLWVAVQALGFYLAKWIAPFGLVPFHPLDAEIDPLSWRYGGALAAVLALSALAVALRRRVPVLAAGLAFTLLTLLPVLGLVQFGQQRAAERYMYLPMLGPTLLVGAGAALAWERGARARGIAVAVSGLAVVLLAWRTVDQLPVWQSSLSLWTRVAAAYPESPLARYNLGHAYAIAGQATRAEDAWTRAVEIDPAYAPALYELGAAAGRRRDYPQARRYFERALAADPGYARARLELAMVLENLGDWPEASKHYREFLGSAPPESAEQIEFARSRLARRGGDPP